MNKIIYLLAVLFLFSCGKKETQKEVTLELESSKNRKELFINNNQELDSSNYNSFYNKILSFLKKEGYSKDIKNSNRYSFNQFKYNNILNIVELVRLGNITNSSLWIDVVIYEYPNSDIALNTAQNIKSDKFLDIIFKDWNNLYVSNKYLVLLKTGCNNSIKEWEQIITKIESIPELREILKCECGGRCS